MEHLKKAFLRDSRYSTPLISSVKQNRDLSFYHKYCNIGCYATLYTYIQYRSGPT